MRIIARAAAMFSVFLGLAATPLSSNASAGIWDQPATCQNGMAWGEECLHGNGAWDSGTKERNQWLEVKTDSATPIAVRYRMSRTPDDFNCEKAQGTDLTLIDHFSVTADKPHKFDLGFGRQWKPGNAVYEWHVCFLIADTVYRAWRGYDPGPGASLNIRCTIKMEQLAAHDTDRYLCPDVEVAVNLDDYSEYAIHCSDDGCLHFKNKADYDHWHQFNPLPDSEQDQIAQAVLLYSTTHPTYLGQNASGRALYLSVRGHDPSPDFLKVFAGTRFNFLPGSQFKDGHGMRISIGAFIATAPGTANGGFGAYCGDLCAGSEAYTMKKTDGVWKVESYRLLWVS